MSSSRADAAKEKETPKQPEFSSDKLLKVLRHAQEEVERKVTAELQRTQQGQQALRRELEEARAKNLALQTDLDKMRLQKNYVSDAFEASRKETSKLI